GIGGKPVLKAYWDYKGYSIGYGHLGAQKGQTITAEEAERLLVADVKAAEREVNGMQVELEQCQFDALVSLVYNIGSEQFRSSTVRRLVRESREARAALEKAWFMWVKVRDPKSHTLKTSVALSERRAREWDMYKGQK
ncbi:MAG: lysozyme, partial [Bacteroidales bacterium]|nr:lysozyme [Bacteroidales bacterium]